MQSKFYITIIIFSFSFQLSAQSDLPKKAIGKPKMFDHPTEQNSNLQNFDEANEWWRVFSDQENNPVYDKPNGNMIQYLSFMQNFVVAEYKNGWIHIVSAESSKWPYFNSHALSIGWIKAKDMLLWDKSFVVDETSKIARKVMIVSSEKDIIDNNETQTNIFFKDSKLKINSRSKPAIFEIYYIFKIDKENKSIFLGKGNRLTGDQSLNLNTIQGWLPASKVTFWDHRQCLEPNPRKEAINERNEKEVEAAIFSEKNQAIDYVNTIKDSSKINIWSSNYTGRMPGNHIRFPIFNREGNIYNLGYIGKLGGDCPCNDVELTKKKEDLIDKKENLHLVFIIDGTKSMKNYYNPISDAIGDLIIKMKNENSRIKIYLTAIVYRNSSDPFGGIQSIKRTDKLSEFNSFLREMKLSKSRKGSKAVYLGLKEGLALSGLTKSETNFIVLIGDTWDDVSDNTLQIRNDIVGWMAEYKTNFVSFQVYNEGKKPYNDFHNYSQKLLLNTAKKIYSSDTELYATINPPRYETIKDGYKLNEQPIVGSFLFADRNNFLSIDLFRSEVTRRLKDFESGLNVSLLEIENLMRGEKTDFLPPRTLAILSEMASRDMIDDLMAGCTGVIMNGYTNNNIAGMEYPLFDNIVFMDRGELDHFISTFGIFVDLKSRKDMKNAWKELLQNVAGEDLWSKRLTFDEAYERLVGIPCPNKTLKNKKIKDIEKRNAFSEEEWRALNSKFSQSIITLKQQVLNNADYEGKYEYGNNIYYWVPLSLFP